ncbi:MAG: N-glycosylase/DNA lyase [Candidatus Lokiarchaeota archaeon]|nr:N-glycosylase/DNA lyase [Candidatus Lokiarchaeota archaeon]
MKELLTSIESLKDSNISSVIYARIKEFSEIREFGIEKIFEELCFCILTANCAAKSCIEVQKRINTGFLKYSEEELRSKFKEYGYRFPNIRAKYIVEARNHVLDIKKKINSSIDEMMIREWLVKTIKGLGYKEASHFLRNIGFKNIAIIDFHIIDLLDKFGIIQKPKTLTKKKYTEIEQILKIIGARVNLDLDELDLYLWYMETNEVLK